MPPLAKQKNLFHHCRSSTREYNERCQSPPTNTGSTVDRWLHKTRFPFSCLDRPACSNSNRDKRTARARWTGPEEFSFAIKRPPPCPPSREGLFYRIVRHTEHGYLFVYYCTIGGLARHSAGIRGYICFALVPFFSPPPYSHQHNSGRERGA